MDSAAETTTPLERADELFPLEGFHGTPKDFDEFDDSRWIHLGTEEQANERLRWLAQNTDPETGELMHSANYAQQMQEGDQVIPLRYRLENPLDMDVDVGLWDDPKEVLFYLAEDPRLSAVHKDLREMGEEAQYVWSQFEDSLEWRRSPEAQGFFDELTDLLKGQGYDGITYPNQVEAKEGFTRAAQARRNQIKAEIKALDEAMYARHEANKPDAANGVDEFRAWLDTRTHTPEDQARIDELQDLLANDPVASEKFTNRSQILFDANQARSRFANFDPARRNEANLLASRPELVGLTGLAAALLAGEGMRSEDKNVY